MHPINFLPAKISDAARSGILIFFSVLLQIPIHGQETRLLRQPSVSDNHITFTYGGDVWISQLDGSNALRITSTPAEESNPVLSPDGGQIAFTSNRSGNHAVYVVPVTGGTPKRLTWHPSPALVRGWTPDGNRILYATSREVAPKPENRLWTIPADGGNPEILTKQKGHSGSFSPDASKIVIDPMDRWDVEWKGYRGGQNTPLIVLDLENLEEVLIPNERSTDIHPVWSGDMIYFLSDRGGVTNIWSYDPNGGALEQITDHTGSSIKWLSGKDQLTFERDGYLYLLDPSTKKETRLEIELSGDFPWAETGWEDVTENIAFASLSPTGKRILMEARGEIFTVPVEYGSARNLTQSSGTADRRPLWSPKGDKVAWFSDDTHGEYVIKITSPDGLSSAEDISIGESKMAWEPVWSPDASNIAFVDNKLRVRILDLKTETIKTIDTGGLNIERGSMGLSWSPDSKWLAYSKTGENNFRRIMLWSLENDNVDPATNVFADAFSPAWDRSGKHLYFLASTDLALKSGWTNTSSMSNTPEYAAYVINLDNTDPSPFVLRSDEENGVEDATADETEKNMNGKDKKADEKNDSPVVKIDLENLDRRIIPLPIPVRNYQEIHAGIPGHIFIAERIANSNGLTLQQFKLSERKLTEYTGGASNMAVSSDGKKMLAKLNGSWQVLETEKPADAGKNVNIDLQMNLDRKAEWSQMFHEAWRYEKDFFYDPSLHGRDWDDVYERYAPLLPFVKHRADLTYLLDQINGELSVGHSFVFGGDYPEVDKSKTGLLGADLVQDNGRWKIQRIYTTENWNPELTSPLDQPGLNIKEGHYLVGLNGKELKDDDNPYELLNGTLDKQTTLHINSSPKFEGAWKEVVKPVGSEVSLRQRAWVEDNRRYVDSLSNGQLAYVWVPNTSGQGLVSFNRYFFAQQDKRGAVIDERFNGGGLLDDYMVDLMTRSPRAAYTNEVPNSKARVMPAGILGPKVLLINEMAGSGGDYFPWVFRQQNAGLLIGTTTWGGLVKSSVHYPLIDGGALTAPDNAIFDPEKQEWIAENVGIAPDIEVRQDALSLSNGRDPQLERAVEELLKQLEDEPKEIKVPPYPTPAKGN